MGKVIKKKIQGMNWLTKTGLVLLLTLATSVFMYQGWYKPMQAQAVVSNPQTWSSLYAGTAFPTSYSYTVNAGSNRLLVVAVSSTVTAANITQTVSATYGTRTMTRAAGNLASTAAFGHTYLFYLKETDLQAATNTTLAVSVSGGTAAYNYVYAAVYANVDQLSVNPYTDAKNFVTTTSQSAVGPFNPALTIATDDQAVEIVNMTRSTSGTAARSISTWATGWTTAGQAPAVADTTSGLYTQLYIRDRNIVASANDTSQHSGGSANSMSSMTAMSIKNYVPPAGTITVGDGTAKQTTQTVTVNSATPPATFVNNFNLIASAADTVSSAQVTLTDASSVSSQIQIRSADGATTYGTVSASGSGAFTVALSPSLSAPTGTPTEYRVYVVPKGSGAIANGTYALTARISSITSVSGYTVTNSDAADATISFNVTAAQPASTIANCGGCHFYTGIAGKTPADSTTTRGASGLFLGNHLTHAGPSTVNQYNYVCTTCHYDHSATGNKHQTGFINISGSKLTGSSYNNNVTVAGVWDSVNHKKTVSNTPTFYRCNNTYCHSNGQSVFATTIAINANVSPTWGSAAGSLACSGCHSGTDGRPNYANGTPKRNTHGTTTYGVTHLGSSCNVCHDGIGGTTGAFTIISTAHHANGVYNLRPTMNYVQAAGSCTNVAGCHAGGTVVWGGSLDCLGCHTTGTLAAPKATMMNNGVTITRRGISTEFGLTSNHTRSRGTITGADCGVCHMEGNVADGSKNNNASTAGAVGSGYHGNGVVELRDPDSGATIIAQSWSQTLPSNTQGAFANKSGTPPAAFVQFARNLATRPELETGLVWPNTTNAGSYPSTTNTRFEVNSAIQVRHCLGCHDAAGATHSSAYIPTASALNPFKATITTNGMTASLRVLDVNTQFLSTNRSYHPVLYKQNNAYAGSTRMAAPWNNVAKSGTTTVFGPLITCWDCHANDNATGSLTATTTHGGALVGTNRVPLRGQTNVSATTNGQANYCLFCHAGYTASQAGHAAGSAFVTNIEGTGRTMTAMNANCSGCHSSIGTAGTKPGRPFGGADAHGFNVKGPTAAVANGAFTAGQGYAFIRANTFYGVTNYMQRTLNVGGTAYVPTCSGATTTGSGMCGRADMGGAAPTLTKTYDPGGSF